MMRHIPALSVLAALALPAAADDETRPQPAKERPAVVKTTPDELPDGIRRFNGMLVGRLVKKDVEQGTFLVAVDAVPRVWRNSRAENPKSILGKNVAVDGVFGKWLDVLLLVKEGETLEFEARHDGGEKLTFPGELLRKVAPVKAGDYPELPEDFRGFQGVVVGRIVKKDAETLELIVRVERVKNTSDRSRAKRPESIVGKHAMLAGFWRRKEAYHGLKVGDTIECGLQHVQPRSDHLTVGELVRKVEGGEAEEAPREPDESEIGFPDGMRGFRGVLRGRLVSKDIEKGEIVVRAESAPRVWKRNEARDPASCKGRTFTLRGIFGKHLDTLVAIKVGDRLEVGAIHNRADYLDFPGELLKKVD